MLDLERQLDALGPGDHVAHLFDDPAERDEVLAAFIAVALRRGAAVCLDLDEKEEAIRIVEAALGSRGIDAAEEIRRGTIELTSFARVDETAGAVDLQAVPERLRETARRVREKHAGLWYGADGLSRPAIELTEGELLEFETRLAEAVADEGLSAVCLCLLDRNRRTPSVVSRVLRTHRRVIVGGTLRDNPFYQPPDAIRGRFTEADEVDWMLRQLEHTVDMTEEVRRQRQSLEKLVENSPDVIARFDSERRHLYVNPAVEEFGFRPEEIVGRTHDELDVPAEIADLWREVLGRVLRTGAGEEITLEYPVSGNRSWYQCRVEPEFGPEGEVESVLCIARDFTGQKEIQGELEETTDQLRKRIKELGCLYEVLRLLQTNVDPLDDRLRRVVEVIPSGWRHPEITGARIVVDDRQFSSESYEPTDWVQRADLDANGESSGYVEVVYLEERPEADDGPFLREEQELIEVIADRIAGAIRQDRAEEERRRGDARFRSLIENTTDVISIVERDGTIRYHSPALRRVLGYEPEDRVGGEIDELVHPDDRTRLLAAFKSLLEDPDLTPRMEYRVRDADDSWRTIESVGHNLLGDPDVEGLVIISRDVTERKRIESERERLEQRLRQSQKLEAIGRLAGGIAHDFNNLLTVIDGHVSFLLDEADLDDRSREDAEAIEMAAKRAADLTRQLLAFSRSQMLKPKVLDPVKVIRGIESLLRRTIGEDIRLTVEVESDVGRIEVDPSQLEQVILNLAVNARDAMPKGGELTLELRRIELSSGQADVAPDLVPGPYAQIVVSDTGEGIALEDQERIFEPFFTTKEMGSGLGLATVYGIVAQSGGRTDVRSAEGVGTTFTVYFPLAGEEGGEVEAGFEQRLPLGGGESILLVEDEEAVRGLSRRVLEQSGYEVLVAEDGGGALEIVGGREEPVDLLVTDVVMPSMSGKELADRLGEEWPETRVLFMSGYTDDAISKHGVLEPDVSFLQKPFTPRQLAKSVRAVLDRED